MNRSIRMRRYNNGAWDSLFPQTLTENVLRRDGSGVLEQYLVRYDNHLYDEIMHFVHGTSTSDNESHRKLKVVVANTELRDGLPLLLTIHTALDAEPSLSYNGSDYKPIISGSGERIPGGQAEGTTMFLVWNRGLDSWILMSTDMYTDITKVAIPKVSVTNCVATENDQRVFVIPGFNKLTTQLVLNYGQTILRQGTDYVTVLGRNDTIKLVTFGLRSGEILHCRLTTFDIVSRRGAIAYQLELKEYHLIPEENGITEFYLPAEVQSANYLEFNYGQTLLREGIDYILADDWSKISTIDPDFTFDADDGDVLVVRAIRMVETDSDVVPRTWNPTGNYRYEIKTVHLSYTAERDNTVLIPVAGYNSRRDELVVVKNNLVLVEGVDYEIDELDQVGLSDANALNTGDTIHFTIFQGTMVDVPPFKQITASGTSGQHLLLDFSYDQLRTGFTCVVKLTNTLVSAPTVKCENGPAEAVVDPFGLPVSGGYKAGSFLWLVYNEDQHVWYSMSHGHYDVSESYSAYEFNEGDSNFLGNQVFADQEPDHIGEVVIPHHLASKPTNIQIHPTENPGIIENPYPAPTVGISQGTVGDQVKWMQWSLWQLGYVNKGISLGDFVTGIYDSVTEDVLESWQTAHHLATDGNFGASHIPVMTKQIARLYYTIGDIWSSADDTNIYVGNTGTATSKFHWYASSTGAEGNLNNLREVINEVEASLKARLGNFETRSVVFTASEDGVYDISIADFSPATEKILMVNFGQTVLREGEDYTETSTGITLRRIRLTAGDILQFVLVEQADD